MTWYNTKSQSWRKRYSKDGVAPARIFGVSPWSPFVTNLNTDTLVLYHPSGQNSLNTLYTIETNQVSRNMWHSKCARITARSTSTTYMNSPASNRPFGTSMARRAS